MKKIAVIVCVLGLLLCGCGGSAGEETTVSGMVISVEGTQVKLVQLGSGQWSGNGERPSFGDGQMSSRPTDGTYPTFPEGERPSRPADGERPTLPEGETRPQGGNRPEGFGNLEENAVTVDLSGAHISVEIDDGKATGSMEDITVGVSLTVTMVDGKATNVLVSQGRSFGGGRGQGGFGGFGGGRNRDENGENAT